MRIQRGKIRSSVLDTEGEGCLLHKPRGRKGCAQACTQTGASEQPAGHLNPDPIPLIPLRPTPSIIPGFLGLQHGRTDPGPGKVAFPQAQHPGNVTRIIPCLQCKLGEQPLCVCGGGTLQATGACYIPTANQP